jgi:hypothetical protein
MNSMGGRTGGWIACKERRRVAGKMFSYMIPGERRSIEIQYRERVQRTNQKTKQSEKPNTKARYESIERAKTKGINGLDLEQPFADWRHDRAREYWHDIKVDAELGEKGGECGANIVRKKGWGTHSSSKRRTPPLHLLVRNTSVATQSTGHPGVRRCRRTVGNMQEDTDRMLHWIASLLAMQIPNPRQQEARRQRE